MQFDRRDLSHWDDPHPVVHRARRRTRLLGAAVLLGAVAVVLLLAPGAAAVLS